MSSHALGLGPHGEQVGHAFDQLAQVEGRRVEEYLAGLDPRRIEQIADQHRERLGVAVHRLGELHLLGIEPRVEQQLAHARHGVERRPDLVADGREEMGLGLAGGVGSPSAPCAGAASSRCCVTSRLKSRTRRARRGRRRAR